MDKSKSLEGISKFIEKTAEEQENKNDKIKEIRKVKSLIDNFSTSTQENITFTIGEINAYLGWNT